MLNPRSVQNAINWLFALSLINLLFTLAVSLKVKKLGKRKDDT
jgi:hypothetical protein